MTVDEIIEAMKKEGSGFRGAFYENFGSGIQGTLLPLAELLERTKSEHPELVEKVAKGMYWGY